MVYFEPSVFHSPVAAALDLEVYWISKIMHEFCHLQSLGNELGMSFSGHTQNCTCALHRKEKSETWS